MDWARHDACGIIHAGPTAGSGNRWSIGACHMTHYHALPKARSFLSLLGWSYVCGILLWFGLRLFFFDGPWLLALLNTIAFYLFLPLAFLLPMALLRRRWRLLFGLIAPCAIFATLFGPLLLPLDLIGNKHLGIMASSH